ncbi:HAD-IA family hydrolase [Streptomyces sp. NPDC046977]|uniref:HAD family hydrolase n=1 Tax=Streptomyces sp. NPDC046977 TaxID=3154703 RepID=UPI00340F4DD6
MLIDPGSRVNADRRALSSVLDAADCVLFDFDGPICHLFEKHPADVIAGTVSALLSKQKDLLPQRLEGSTDPHKILRETALAARAKGDGLPQLLVDAEQHVSEQEMEAARVAGEPTRHVRELIKFLVCRGKHLAVTSNNSPEAVRCYLENHELPAFGNMIFGRDPDPALMKPHPHCVDQALAAVGVPGSRALLIGDSESDLRAAQASGVAFLGFDPNARKFKGVLAVTALSELLTAFSDAT